MINLSVNLANVVRHSGPNGAVSKALTLSSASFGDKLSEALTLSKFGIDPASIKLTVENVASQNNVARQNSVPQKPAAVAMAAALGFKGLVPHTPVTSSTTPASPASATPQKHWYAEDAADDAYWSKQPDAVQKLREIEDPGQRAQMAGQLTAQGYLIDVPVMVWGWDAAKTTQLRQSFGYTWVPSAESQQVSSAPGLTAPGVTAYDPAHPPAGSLAV